ncbi:MAG: hypothetical protein BucCj_2100 [Buchnera aphidicola (Ceratovacuna japonica)]
MIKIIDDFFELNKTILNLRSFKEESIASNIANSETPNYNKKYVNFNKIIKKICFYKKRNLYTTSKKHIKNNFKILNKNNYTNFLTKKNFFDINNKIDTNEEKIKFLKNSLKYEIDLSIIKKKIKNIYLVIQG